ncbi:MAG: UDP-N-acetylmuramoyl-tripeptide--D-alanyl-D-alanine ligase [Clostridia bacterium]|nr:UDP-N-acetylmuramoyl-tripeptide--D-alanyl-D-alanine ligase [Clostridia bacterium]
MEFKFRDIAYVLGRKVSKDEESIVITGFSTDTRTIEPGTMFIAIPGENYDGGNFVQEAFSKGAIAAISEKDIKGKGIIVVKDVIKSLGKIASVHRQNMGIPSIAITGSTGKTSTRNFILAVLAEKFNTHGTVGNLNNHIGLPMSLLTIDNTHEVSVLEMGMSELGEIDYLAGIAKPDFGVITNIGMSHIGLLGSRENIFKAKSELADHIEPGGLLVVNGDDEFLIGLRGLKKPKVMTFGKEEHNDHIFHHEKANENGCYSFIYDNHKFNLGVRGFHNIYNAMSAIVIAREMGLTYTEIANGLLKFKNEKLRLETMDFNGITVINDSYNASPDSMKSSISILGDFKGRKIAILGDMLEMGEYSKKAHEEVGVFASKTVEILICCGKESKSIASGARNNGMSEDRIYTFDTSDQAGDFLRDLVKEGDVVLVKGSRGMKMENVIKYIETGGN